MGRNKPPSEGVVYYDGIKGRRHLFIGKNEKKQAALCSPRLFSLEKKSSFPYPEEKIILFSP
ncbi:MAG: hypothetical protein D3908_15130 [Candidatus Electrothrix sp. AUS4]|nr:hypothetical protein [Candidatus Electrothrix sp. AUS4]